MTNSRFSTRWRGIKKKWNHGVHERRAVIGRGREGGREGGGEGAVRTDSIFKTLGCESLSKQSTCERQRGSTWISTTLTKLPLLTGGPNTNLVLDLVRLLDAADTPPRHEFQHNTFFCAGVLAQGHPHAHAVRAQWLPDREPTHLLGQRGAIGRFGLDKRLPRPNQENDVVVLDQKTVEDLVAVRVERSSGVGVHVCRLAGVAEKLGQIGVRGRQ